MKVRHGKELVKRMMQFDRMEMKHGRDINWKSKSLNLLIYMVSSKVKVMSNEFETNCLKMALFIAQNKDRFVSEFTDQFGNVMKIGELSFKIRKGGVVYYSKPAKYGNRTPNVFMICDGISIWTDQLWKEFDVMKYIRLTDLI